jgi:hypothetical protein
MEGMDMKFTKELSRWISEDGAYRITETSSNCRRFHGKYYVSKKGSLQGRYASTLKEAKQVATDWSKEV